MKTSEVERSQAVQRSQAVHHRMNKALRILLIYEYLGWEGILGGGWITKTHLHRNKVTMKAWNKIVNEVAKERSRNV